MVSAFSDSLTRQLTCRPLYSTLFHSGISSSNGKSVGSLNFAIAKTQVIHQTLICFFFHIHVQIYNLSTFVRNEIYLYRLE